MFGMEKPNKNTFGRRGLEDGESTPKTYFEITIAQFSNDEDYQQLQQILSQRDNQPDKMEIDRLCASLVQKLLEKGVPEEEASVDNVRAYIKNLV